MDVPAGEPTPAAPPEPAVARAPSASRTALVAWYRRLALHVEAWPLERIGLAALAAGIVLRLAAPFFMDFRADGDTYTAMGHAWMRTHSFLMPYGDVTTWAPTPPGYSNHYPPAYPFYLGIVFSIFGFGLWQAKIAAVVVALVALAAVYATTRDLYGRVPASLAAGLLALEPHLVWVTGTGFSENMVLLFFTLTMWAILRSLENDRFIVLAGLFAALAYLSRASVGYFFVIAGGGGLLWRLYFRGWRVLLNRWYLTAIAVFLSIALLWAYRNASLFPPITETIRVFGRSFTVTMPAWETSSYTRYVQNYAYERLATWRHSLLVKFPFFLAMLAMYVVPFIPEAFRATKKIKDEHTSALWLSVFLVWAIAWVIASMFWVFESGASAYWFDNHRYVVIGLLPLAWLLLREARLPRASVRIRYVMLILALFAASGAVFTDPIRYSDLRAAEHMDGYLRAGDEVAVDGGTIKYAFYPYLTRPEEILIYGCEAPDPGGNMTGPCHGEPDAAGHEPAFIVSLRYGASYQGFKLAGTFSQHFADGLAMTTTLWVREDVAAARGVPLDQKFEYR